MSARQLLGFLAILVWLVASAPASAESHLPHHDADVVFDPVTRYLEVIDRVTVAPATEISIALAGWMKIDSVEGDSAALSVSRAGRSWRVTSPNGPVQTFTIRASGTVPAMPPPDQRRGVRGALADPEEGSFLPSYAVWLPNTGADLVTYRLRVRIAGPQRAVATGRIVSETVTASDFRGVFAADYGTEPPSLFVGPYSIDEKVVDGIRIRTYFHEEIVGSAEHYISQSAAYIRLFEDIIGPYPFDDFHIVSAPLPVGLGFPNMTYIGRTIVPLPFMRGRSLAHEVLHNWWGNGVAVDYADGNWSEGLTTYFADYGLAVQRGPDAAREMRLGWLRDFAALPVSDDKPVSSFISKSHQASQIIGYNKLAHVFHMLRDEIGDAAFDEAIRDFWREYRMKTAGWPDIRRTFEKAARRDLTWFFDQWIERTGAPQIEIADAEAKKRDGGYAVSLSVRQTGEAYQLSIPVVLETMKGTVHRKLRVSDTAETAIFELDSAPLRIHVDPDFDLFRRLLPGESPPIMRDITLAERVDAILLTTGDEAFRDAATALVNRLSRNAAISEEKPRAGPAIVIGSEGDIGRYVQDAQGVTVPGIATSGSASAWTYRGPDGHPVLFIRAVDASALSALIRPLPHYGSRSYVTFEGRRARDKGVWKTDNSPLSRDFAKTAD